MKRFVKILIATAIIINSQLSTLNSVYAQLGCKQVKKESCKPGNDGEARITGITNAMLQMCTIEWTAPDGQKLMGVHPTGLKAGAYSVVVKANACDKIIYQDVCIIEREDACKIGATISVSTTPVKCNQQPTATLVASPIGGTPPYQYTWKTKTVSGSGTYGVTITDSNGFVGSASVRIDLKMQKCPEDPNEIDGPVGYGDDHLVSTNDRMRYTILYENSPEFASAPASLVNIVYPIPPEHNINSVRLSDFGFGSFVFSVPSNTTAYTQRLDVSDSLGVWVDVTAGIDMANNQIFWNLQSVDPATGFEPSSSDLGFLLINDSLHHGEGYVSFSILPKNNVVSGDTVGAEATIIFNENTAIATNVWVNKFDAVAPTSTLHGTQAGSEAPVELWTLAESYDSIVHLTFAATDDLSGVDNVELLVSRNGSVYTSEGYYALGDTAHYTLEDGYLYSFISRATDNVGNQEPLKAVPDTVINYSTAPVDILLSNNSFDENAEQGTLIGTLTSIDNDITLPFVYELVSGEGDDDNISFYLDGNKLYTGSSYACTGNFDYSVRIRTTDITGLSFEKAFELNAIQQNFPYIKSSNESICQGSTYEFGNRYLTAAGTYTDSLATVRGCDSVITVNLTVHPTSHNTNSQTICENQSFSWTGHNLTIDTLEVGHFYYYDTMYTTMGCDSTFTLVLNVNATSASTDSANVCDNYTWNGTTYTVSGTHTYQTVNSVGCDSIATLYLTVRHSTTSTDIQTACDSYTWHGTTYTASTTTGEPPVFHTTNSVGCDSVATLHLTVNYSTTSTDIQTACDSYTWHGTTYTASTNTPSFTTINSVGCDSIATLHLTVNYSNSGIETQDVCDSYTWHGITYTASTSTPTFTTTNSVGCDSIATLHLTVRYSSTGTETQNACDSYTWHGTTYTASTDTPTFTTNNTVGCDSIATLHLTIRYSTASTDVQTACDSYTWHGTTYTSSNFNSQFSTLNSQGCDSTVTLNLTINYSNSGTDVQTACDSYTWHGTTFTASNSTATFVGTNIAGCDSTTTLNLTVNYSNSGTETQDVCDSFTWHGTTYTASTDTPTFTEQNAAGCDSVVTLNLTIRYSTTGDTSAMACDEFTWYGTTYTASGTQLTTLTNAAGCDSVVTLNLTINYSTTGTDVQTACDEFTWIDGVTYTVSTTTGEPPVFHTTNSVGCDSIATLHLTINYSVTVYDSLTLAQSELPYDYHGNNVNAAGDYTFDGTTTAGCDSTTLLHVEVLEGIEPTDPLANLKVYPNPTRGTLTIASDDVLKVDVYDLSGRHVATFEGMNTFDITNLTTGTYTLRIKTTRGDTVRRIVKK